MIFSGQSEVAADTRRHEVIDEVNDKKIKKYKSGQRPVKYVCQQQEENGRNQADNIRGTLKQMNQPPPWLESAQFWAIGIATMIAGYLMYFLWIDHFSLLRDFLFYVFNPGTADNLTTNNPLCFGVPLLFWMGVAIISVKGVSRVWPHSLGVFLAVFFVVLFPVFLLWFIWSLPFLVKITWTVCYLSNVWLFFVYEL